MFLARREIRTARGRFGLMLGVVALICLLLVVLTALTSGLGRQSTSAIDQLPAGHVVLSSGSSGAPSFSESVITGQQARAFTEAGVRVEPLLVGQARLAGPGGTASAAVFGVDPAGRYAASLHPAQQAGPASGAPVSLGHDEIALDEATAAALGARPGTQVSANGRPLRVCAVIPTEWMSHQPVVVAGSDVARVLSPPQPGEVATALLVTERTDAGRLAAIDARAGTRSMTPAESRSALPAYQSEQGSLLMIQGFLYAISGLVVVAFVSVWTIQRTRQIAVLRALGASRRYVLVDSLGQAAVLLAAGVALGTTLGLLALVAVGDRAPVLVSGSTILQPALGVAVLGLVGSYLATRRVTRVDPMLALGGN